MIEAAPTRIDARQCPFRRRTGQLCENSIKNNLVSITLIFELIVNKINRTSI